MSTKNKRILIFGFKPYQQYTENITETIIEKIKRRKNLWKFVFPVRFDRKIFMNAVEKCKPEIIIGLGQYPRAKRIRVERRAKNLMRLHKNIKQKSIEGDGSRYRFVSLKLNPHGVARVTYDAGDYVCNFCMYILSGISRKKRTRFAFLHIPKEYNVYKAVRFVEAKIRESVL